MLARQKVTQPPRGKNWTFTLNNYTEEEESKIIKLQDDPQIKFIIVGKEVGSQNQTPHLQGYVQFHMRKYFNAVKALIGERAHIELAKGSPDQNVEYCSKEGNILIETHLRNPEIRLNKEEECQTIINDACIMEPQEFMKSHAAFYLFHKPIYERFFKEKSQERQNIWCGSLAAKNFWIYGPPSTGKSRLAYTGYEVTQIYPKSIDNNWEGFVQDKIKRVIIDNFQKRYKNRTDVITQLLKWADRYPFMGHTKDAEIWISPTYQLFVVSHYSIDQCGFDLLNTCSLQERFTEVNWDKDYGTLEDYFKAQQEKLTTTN